MVPIHGKMMMPRTQSAFLAPERSGLRNTSKMAKNHSIINGIHTKNSRNTSQNVHWSLENMTASVVNMMESSCDSKVCVPLLQQHQPTPAHEWGNHASGQFLERSGVSHVPTRMDRGGIREPALMRMAAQP